MKKEELLQKDYYNKIANDYSNHYHDFWNIIYLKWCIVPKLFNKINLSNKIVLDALCGTGLLTEYLITQNPQSVIGIDISEGQLSIYQEKFPDAKSICSSITKTNLKSNSIDVICIFGGLHHVHPRFKETINELYRLLKPGGYLCFYEPQAHTILEPIRTFWYRHDSEFNDNEGAINIDQFKADFQQQFEFISETYVGTLAHFLVLNSKIFRIPYFLKWIYAPFLILLESFINYLPLKYIASNAIVRLRKK